VHDWRLVVACEDVPETLSPNVVIIREWDQSFSTTEQQN
jgi:hypothetical protein